MGTVQPLLDLRAEFLGVVFCLGDDVGGPKLLQLGLDLVDVVSVSDDGDGLETQFLTDLDGCSADLGGTTVLDEPVARLELLVVGKHLVRGGGVDRDGGRLGQADVLLQLLQLVGAGELVRAPGPEVDVVRDAPVADVHVGDARALGDDLKNTLVPGHGRGRGQLRQRVCGQRRLRRVDALDLVDVRGVERSGQGLQNDLVFGERGRIQRVAVALEHVLRLTVLGVDNCARCQSRHCSAEGGKTHHHASCVWRSSWSLEICCLPQSKNTLRGEPPL